MHVGSNSDFEDNIVGSPSGPWALANAHLTVQQIWDSWDCWCTGGIFAQVNSVEDEVDGKLEMKPLMEGKMGVTSVRIPKIELPFN